MMMVGAELREGTKFTGRQGDNAESECCLGRSFSELYYRVTHQVVLEVLSSSKQKFQFSKKSLH